MILKEGDYFKNEDEDMVFKINKIFTAYDQVRMIEIIIIKHNNPLFFVGKEFTYRFSLLLDTIKDRFKRLPKSEARLYTL